MDLEAQNIALQSELDGGIRESSKPSQDPTSRLPKSPPRYSPTLHEGTVNSVSFHTKFSSTASGSDDCTIKIWDWEFGEPQRTIKGHAQAVRDIDYGGPMGVVLLASCGSDLSIKLWDSTDYYTNIRTLQGHDHSVSCVRFIPSGPVNDAFGNLLISASGDQTLKIWNADTGQCLRTLQGHTDWVRSVCPSTDGRFLLSAGNDCTVRLWDISVPNPENTPTLMGHDHGINCCALAPAASYAYLAAMGGLKVPPPSSNTSEFTATGSRDKTIKLWDARRICLKTLIGHDDWVSEVEFHPGGKYLIPVADDKTLRCWDLSLGTCINVLAGIHEQFITCHRWAPKVAKNTAIANERGTTTGSMDRTVKIFAS